MPLSPERLNEIVADLANRPSGVVPGRHEHVRVRVTELLEQGLGADISAIGHEVRVVEARGRIDALLGRTVVEFKSDLRRERKDAVEELSRYLPEREAATGERFVGVVTDGADWEAYELRDGAPFLLRTYRTDVKHPGTLLAWLDGAVATQTEIPPDAENIIHELGAQSIAYLRAETGLRAAWEAVKDHPTASLQRQLWSQLLTLVYGKAVEDDGLWLQHTFLVIVAKSIAARIMEVEADDPEAILSGRAFVDAGVYGAVESDFFDWILLAPGGPDLVQKLARHVARFKLRAVKADVLKILYESLIDRSQRHGLGEYYTPDWLAARVVEHAVERPLEQTVLDPACGSGTFLFQAVRRVLAEAEEGGLEREDQAGEACRLVAGMDIHPVAVIIARVTFLLALAPVLGDRQGDLSIPVYLGDAMQLEVRKFMRGQELVVHVPSSPGHADVPVVNGATGGLNGGAAMLVFPQELAKTGPLFDKLIEAMKAASLADEKPAQFRHRGVRTIEIYFKRDLTALEQTALDDLTQTFVTFHALRQAGRDTIWTYVARNLTRPFTYSAGVRWASVLVGNPPWLAFRHMSEGLQKRFRELSRAERLLVTGKGAGKMATQNDLCALFTVRAAGLYLKASGRIAMVLPWAVLRGGQYEPFRTGSYDSARIAWDETWDLDAVEPLFPVPACVLFGRRRATATRTPDKVLKFSGRLPMRDASAEMAAPRIKTVGADAPRPGDNVQSSAYGKMFLDGATLYPRMLCLVERKSQGKLGSTSSRPLVVSRRGAQDKRPWRDLPGVEHAVEVEFLRPVYLGESILPFRVFKAFEGVVPMDARGNIMGASGAADAGQGGLSGWMRAAEKTWTDNKGDNPLTLAGQFDFYGKLGSQFPPKPLRVVYAKAGTQPAACLVRDATAVIDHMLYWTEPASEDEAYFLIAILNSEEVRGRIARLQARGLFGARHFDKVMFTLPIPRFSAGVETHRALAAAGRRAESQAAAVALPEAAPFTRARRAVREALAASGASAEIDRLVEILLDGENAVSP